MTAVIVEPALEASCVSEGAGEFYARLLAHLEEGHCELVYTAASWFEELLEPLDYAREDQNAVFTYMRELQDSKLLTKETVRPMSGYHARLRRNTPRPRRVRLTVR